MHGFDILPLLANPAYRTLFVQGVATTMVVAVGSWLLAMAVAVLLLGIRTMPGRIGAALAVVFISYHRNVPTLVQLILWYFGIASLLPDAWQGWLGDHNGETVFAIIGLGLCLVLLPQALRNALPALVSHTVSLFKNSSLATAIGVAELTHAVQDVESASFRTFEAFLIGTVIYLFFSLLLMAGGALLEHRCRLAGAH